MYHENLLRQLIKHFLQWLSQSINGKGHEISLEKKLLPILCAEQRPGSGMAALTGTNKDQKMKISVEKVLEEKFPPQ